MLADAALAQIGLADIPQYTTPAPPPIFTPPSLIGIDANAQLLGVDTIPGPTGRSASPNLIGTDLGVTLKGNKSDPTVN